MTGAEHYREAEKLIDRAWHFTYGDGNDAAVGQAFATMAQAHATLALVAAQVDAACSPMTSGEMAARWQAAASS